jgi:hypothetical protein
MSIEATVELPALSQLSAGYLGGQRPAWCMTARHPDTRRDWQASRLIGDRDESRMELRRSELDLLSDYLTDPTALAGDRCSDRQLAGMVRGVIGSESFVCSRVAAVSR